jgi:hypothetical protein
VGNINLGRVVLGGLVAGLVVNVGEFILNTFIFAQQNTEMLKKLGLPDVNNGMIVRLVILTFVSGVVLVWMYAAMRPRFGAGVKTAIIAGLTLWVVSMLLSLQLAVVGISSVGDLVLPGIWSLIELPIAAIVGAYLYREASAA